jgi:hypothetical protein
MGEVRHPEKSNRREAYDNRHYVRPALRMTLLFDGGRGARLHNARLSDDRP